MTLYIGVIIGFLIGTMAGITFTAILVAARSESRRIMGLPEPDFAPPPPPEHETHWIAYERGRYACREFRGPNPYIEHSVFWHRWNKGWNDELDGVRAE